MTLPLTIKRLAYLPQNAKQTLHMCGKVGKRQFVQKHPLTATPLLPEP